MKDKLKALIEKYKKQVDYLEIRFEKNETTSIRFIGKSLDTLSQSESSGGYVRSLYKGAWGFCSFNDLEALEKFIQESVKQAIFLGSQSNEKSKLAEVNPIERTCEIKLSGKDPRKISLDSKVELFKHYNSLLLSTSDKVTTATSRYFEKLQDVTFLNSEGSMLHHGWIDMEARFSATCKENGTVQVASETLGSRKGFEEIEGLDERIKSAGKRSVDQLTLKPPKAGTYTVVIDPILTGLFVHEAFGHLSEGDFIFENPKMQEFMTFGKKFGEPFLNILDGGKIADHRGSLGYDDEGTEAQDTYLIKEGVLVGRLHSRETAGKLGEKPTGNARCLDYRYPPIVRMTNTWIEPQNHSVRDLISDIKLGIWAGNWLGGQTNGEMFTFASGEARMIRDGKLAEPIKDVNLSGNVFQTLKDIEGIGNDMYWDESGGCGKAGQSGMPVGVGGPSIRIKNMMVPGD